MKLRLLAVIVLCIVSVSAIAQQSNAPAPRATQDPASGIEGDFREALDLMRSGKYVQAKPLLERVVVAKPNDSLVLEQLAICVINESAQTLDPAARKQIRRRAYELLQRSKQNGNDSNYVKVMLETLPPDGGETSFSNNAEAEKSMREAEAAFGRADYKAAIDGYLRALLIDPNLYAAALFLGDTYYKQNQFGSAGEWYTRATQIDPNTETAYRYWGDALMASGDMKAARAKFIDAIIAEPYGRASWAGLSQWADRNNAKLTRPNIVPRTSVTDKPGEDGKQSINITLDLGRSKKPDPSSTAWLMYGMTRALWHGDKFKQEFPNEKQYRHSLKEEADSLRVAVSALDKKQAKKAFASDPSLAKVAELDGKGLLEAHLLLGQPDPGIAQDYVAYREKNRDKLRQYLDEYIAPKLP